MYARFGLVLMVNHACNLRCSYCYTGDKFARAMPEAIGQAAIARAIRSLEPAGTLELGFFGGEPLLEAGRIASFIEHARRCARDAGPRLSLSMTTNGTITHPEAWAVLTLPDLDLAVSHDGLPFVHDRHRRSAGGHGSAEVVLAAMQRLLDAGKDLRVVMVVRPDTVDFLPDGIEFLRGAGVRRFDLSLDLWTRWSCEDGPRLERAVARCARIWRAALPDIAVSWFDEKAALLAGFALSDTARCGFGDGEIAVAPSGRLYPCERLIGEDRDDNPMRLPGHALEGDDFLGFQPSASRSAPACNVCQVQSLCSTTCRCSNYVRTGRVDAPDGLLCLLEQVCLRETARVLNPPAASAPRTFVALSA